MYCCFTGHRPEQLVWRTNEDDARCINLKKALENIINECIENNYLDFYCGMARGVDTYAAEIIAEKKKTNKNIKLHAILPCPNQSEGWNEKEHLRYKGLLTECDTKTVISPFYTDTCMLTRNRFMVNNSDLVIAVWNGYFKGGTAYTVRYAKKQSKKIYLIRPKDSSVSVI